MQLQTSTLTVTGRASGLGEATARHFYEAGANVVIADIRVERAQALAEEPGARAGFARTDASAGADALERFDGAVRFAPQ